MRGPNKGLMSVIEVKKLWTIRPKAVKIKFKVGEETLMLGHLS